MANLHPSIDAKLAAEADALAKQAAELKLAQAANREAQKARKKEVQLAREAELGQIAYAAGLGAVEDEVWRSECTLLAQRLCGRQPAFQRVDAPAPEKGV